MQGPSRRAALPHGLLLLGLLAALALPGCGRSRGPLGWIFAEPAVIRCSIAGRDRMSPVFAEIPTPPVPTGFFARTLDPIALDDLGFTRDEVVCASLDTPPPGAPEALSAALVALAETRREVGIALQQQIGVCGCEAARELGLVEIVAGCRAARERGCPPPGPAEVAAVEPVVAPLREALAKVPLLGNHHRLAGPTDRPGWLLENLPRLLERHPTGAAVYGPSLPPPVHGNARLIERLLAADGVVAVARQDAGRALLVVRELGSDLVLDHFAYPVGPGAPSDLLAQLDDARADVYLAALAAPEAPRAPSKDPKAGMMVEIDRLALERVDAAVVAATAVGVAYPVEAERREAPPSLVQRAILQAPHGHEGERLELTLELDEEGRAWAAALPEALPVLTAEALGLSPDEPRFAHAEGRDPGYLLRGTTTEQVVFFMIQRAPALLLAIQAQHPEALSGTPAAFTMVIPPGPLAPRVDTAPGWKAFRDRLSKRRHRLEGRFDAGRTALTLTFGPQ